MFFLKKVLSKIPVIKHQINRQDCRSARFVAVIECILNQNCRDNGAAMYPAMNQPVIDLCQQNQVGIMQMPCPEIAALGFFRKRPPGISIREALDTQSGRAVCRQLSIDIARRIDELVRQDAVFLAVLGGNPESPGCAVNFKAENSTRPSGIFITQLKDELTKRNIEVPFLPVRDFSSSLLAEDLRQIEHLFINT